MREAAKAEVSEVNRYRRANGEPLLTRGEERQIQARIFDEQGFDSISEWRGDAQKPFIGEVRPGAQRGAAARRTQGQAGGLRRVNMNASDSEIKGDFRAKAGRRPLQLWRVQDAIAARDAGRADMEAAAAARVQAGSAALFLACLWNSFR